MKAINQQINQWLQELAESDYKKFNERIIPTNYDILGIRMPVLKKLAKEVADSPEIEFYLKQAELLTYEQILLYGLVLGQRKKLSPGQLFRYLDPLILKFDNWAHVDTIISSLKIFQKYPEEVLAHFLPLKTDAGEFTKRTFVIILMDYYMDESHLDATLKHFIEVPQGQYYVDMAIAWALSVAFVKNYDKTLPFFTRPVFTKFVHNKAIQKARESYRITPDTKEYLNGLKIK